MTGNFIAVDWAFKLNNPRNKPCKLVDRCLVQFDIALQTDVRTLVRGRSQANIVDHNCSCFRNFCCAIDNLAPDASPTDLNPVPCC